MKKQLLALGTLATLANSANAEKINLIVRQSNGTTPISGVQVQYVTSQFYNLDTTNSAGQLNAEIPVTGKYSLKLTYRNTTRTYGPFTASAAGNTLTVNTDKLTVTAKNCGVPVPNVALTYVFVGGGFTSMGATDAAGQATAEIFMKDSLRVRGISKGSLSDSYVTNGASTSFELTKVNIPNTSLVIGGSFVPANNIYVFSGKYRARMFNNAIYDDSVIISGCTAGKWPLVVTLKDSKNNPISGASASYYYNGWVNMGQTSSNGVAVAYVNADPVNLTTAVSYEGAVQQKAGVHTYQTRKFVVNFNKAADAISYYANGWKSMGTTKELLPYPYTIAVSYIGAVQQKSYTVADSVASFNTVAVTLNTADCDGLPLTASSYSYYANGWKAFDGPTMDLLPYNYTFGASINGSNGQQSVNITGNQTVTMVAPLLSIGGLPPFSTASYYANGWKSFPMTTPNRVGVNLFAGNYTVAINGVQSVKTVAPCGMNSVSKIHSDGIRGGLTIYPNPATTMITVDVEEDAQISIYSLDGRQVAVHSISAGSNRIDIAAFPAGNYIIKAGENIVKFVKQ